MVVLRWRSGFLAGSMDRREDSRGDSEPRFIVDSMLGDLARWLRMLGYDTLYYKSAPDGYLVEKALKEERIILTRDRGLLIRALKRGARALLVQGGDTASRLAFLAAKLGIRLYVDPDLSRCPLCNGPLARVTREAVRGRVPPEVYERHNEFWVCLSCGQVYWRGGHWRGIEATLYEARRRLRARGSRASTQPRRRG